MSCRPQGKEIPRTNRVLLVAFPVLRAGKGIHKSSDACQISNEGVVEPGGINQCKNPWPLLTQSGVCFFPHLAPVEGC